MVHLTISTRTMRPIGTTTTRRIIGRKINDKTAKHGNVQ